MGGNKEKEVISGKVSIEKRKRREEGEWDEVKNRKLWKEVKKNEVNGGKGGKENELMGESKEKEVIRGGKGKESEVKKRR